MPYKDKVQQRTAQARLVSESKARKRAYLDTLRQQGCSCCGMRDIECLDFHHLNPAEKRKTIAVMTQNGTAMRVLVQEVAKCILLCANCHRKVHAGTLVP